MEPWTQRIAVSWPVTLNFYERRYALLRKLEEGNLLRRFHSQDDRVHVLLGDPNHELTLRDDGLDLRLLQPDASLDRAREALLIVLDGIAPKRLARPRLTFRWLVELAADYDEAREEAGRQLFDPPRGVAVEDFALVVDGATDEPPASYHLECGIVDRAETPDRLARPRRGVEPGSSVWLPESLPEVAFFCDSEWEIQQAADPSADGVMEIWSQMRETARRVVVSLTRQVVGEDIE